MTLLTRLLTSIYQSLLVALAHAQNVRLRYLQTLAGIAGDKINIFVFGFRQLHGSADTELKHQHKQLNPTPKQTF